MYLLPAERLNDLIEALTEDGFDVIGPAVRSEAIEYVPIRSITDLPLGISDVQGPGQYRLEAGGDRYFGYVSAAQSWKRQIYEPEVTLFTTEVTPAGLTFTPAVVPGRPRAFLGVRACEMAAIRMQDHILGDLDQGYAGRRDGSFIIGVNCATAASTCFCTSMGTGPELTDGFDLALTEIVVGDHRFVVEVGTEVGEVFIAGLDLEPATDADRVARGQVVADCVASVTKSFDEPGTKELLQSNPEHVQWDDVATRCLACGSCTMVCPTCFCSEHEEITGLDGSIAHRRRWESCFSIEFSTLHGQPVRSSVGSRYRQWLTHKLAHWYDQFGSSGCVGCGRCITWCPVGIDLTKEVEAIRASEGVQA